MVTVGIFWVIDGNVVSRKEEKNIEKEKTRRMVEITGRIDSDYGHDTEWEKELKFIYKKSSYSYYPRGRVLYDINKNEHVIFADSCITEEEFKKIAETFNSSKYRIERDIHYSCHKCIHKHNIWD